jgi:RHS repeat-associated protein
VANVLTGLGVDEYFVRTDAGGPSTILTDALGSTVALTDSAGGVQTQYTYEPFGATTKTGAATGNSIDYTERESDATGLKYYRARYYHPGLQRFISEDPIGFAAGDTNVYAYVFNSPTELRDPSGLAVDPVSLTVLGIMCGGGAVVGVVSTYTLAGRKATCAQLGTSAAVGCGVGVLTLTAGIAAGVTATGGILLSDAVTAGSTAAAGRGLDAILRSDPKTFHRFLESLQGRGGSGERCCAHGRRNKKHSGRSYAPWVHDPRTS